MSDYAPGDYQNASFVEALAGFTKETGIEVTPIYSGANEIYTAYETSVLAKKSPDVLFVNLYDKSTTWTSTGATLPVTQYIKDWGLDKVVSQAAVSDWTDAKGQVQAFPYFGFSWPMWYNKALFEKAGIPSLPATTDDLIADAPKLKAIGVTPIAISGSDSLGQKFFLQIIQTLMSEDEAKKVFAGGGYCSSPSAMKGIDEFLRLSKAGVFSENAQGLIGDNVVADFYQSKAAMLPDGSWQFSATPKELVPSVELGGMPVPAGSRYTKPVMYQAYTSSAIWLTPSGTKRLSDVEKFVKYMYESNVASSVVAGAGNVPVQPIDGLETSLASQPLLLQALTDTPARVDYAVFPDLYVPGAKTQALVSAIATAYAPGATSSDVCAALDGAYK
ncbi:ABC transporter substrate-binding protein [Subtercola boreus]|nr:ABC transporter substrate-binding protein [Subtercola boreus]